MLPDAIATVGAGLQRLHGEEMSQGVRRGPRAAAAERQAELSHRVFKGAINIFEAQRLSAQRDEEVIIEGRIVMRDRRLLTLNEETIKADARRYRERIIQSLGSKTLPED